MLTGGRRFELNIKNALTRVVVSVFREGARETLTDITVEYSNDAPQAMWGSFLRRVSEALDLPTLDGIYTENEGYYVARITSLINGARYFKGDALSWVVHSCVQYAQLAMMLPPLPSFILILICSAVECQIFNL